MNKVALITGILGQDAAYLSKHLLESGYKVVGTSRRNASSEPWRLKELGILSSVEIVYMELLELTNIKRVLDKYNPDEVYNLASQSFVTPSFDMPLYTIDVNALGPARLLEALRESCATVKFYQASSSEMFGKVNTKIQNENTPFHPRSPYGVAKVAAHLLTVNYRESYNMFALGGILFNHESELRGLEFVTRKISNTVASIYHGKETELVVGNIEALRDWGHSEDYVKAMHLMMCADNPVDYVVSTGITHSVKDFINIAFSIVGINLEWEGSGISAMAFDQNDNIRVRVDQKFYRPLDIDILCGDYSKINRELGWKPTIIFENLVTRMVEYDLRKNKNV